MKGKAIKIFVFLFFSSYNAAFSQSDLRASAYDNWLKTIQMDKFLQVNKIIRLDSLIRIEPGTSNHRSDSAYTAILLLGPAPGQTDPQEMASTWNFVQKKLQDSAIDLYSLLLCKFADYEHLPLNKVKIEMMSSSADIFSLTIYFNTRIEHRGHVNIISGGDLSVDFDPNVRAFQSLIKNIYKLKQPIADLSNYINPLQDFFKKGVHKPGEDIHVTILSSSNDFLELEITGIFGEVTKKNYYEKIDLTITLNSGKGTQQLKYHGNIFCAAGIERSSEFDDIANEDDVSDQLPIYNQKLDKAFKAIFHDHIQ